MSTLSIGIQTEYEFDLDALKAEFAEEWAEYVAYCNTQELEPEDREWVFEVLENCSPEELPSIFKRQGVYDDHRIDLRL
jgi:hypothetical protein